MKTRAIFTLLLCYLTALSLNAGVTVLFIGDSITDGNWGSPVGWPCPTENRNLTDKNHIYGHGFAEMVAGYYQGEYPSEGFTFYNRGISGNTLANLEQRWTKDALELHPNVVSILVGTNDVNEFLDQDSIREFDFIGWERRYRALLDKTRQELSDVKFVLAAPFVAEVGNVGARKDYAQRAEAVSRLADITRNIAKDYNAVLIDVPALLERCYADYPDIDISYWIWDGIHPTTATHHLIARSWIAEAGGYMFKK
jgi:lysophospholipase L1-like esterase